MKNLHELDKYRVENSFIPQTECSGIFKVMVNRRCWTVIATVDQMKSGRKMEHISISHKNENKMPTWDDLTAIKNLFFEPEEECIQFFPKQSQYVNLVNNCLHIWRPVDFDWNEWT